MAQLQQEIDQQRQAFAQESTARQAELEQRERVVVTEREKSMVQENTPYLLHGSPEVVARRFELMRRENDCRNRNMLSALARTR